MKTITSIRFWSVFCALLLGITLNGCFPKFITDYDGATFDEIITVGKKVDRFYGDLLEEPEKIRLYKTYAERYVEIETDLRSLQMRNQARPLNQDSTEISEIILSLWIKYKGNHATKNIYSTGNAKLDRNRFNRLFVSAANAEFAKKLGADDKNPDKDSK